MFQSGQLSAEQASLLNEMLKAYQQYGLRVGVTSWPLTIDRPGRLQGQIVGIDPKAFTNFFFAEILGSGGGGSAGSGTDGDGRAYSWVERVQTPTGSWIDGSRWGEFDAYVAEPEAGYSGTVDAGTMVIMRQSPTVGGTWEFLAPGEGAAGTEYFFAQLTSGSSPYSWAERVETSAGVWANGSLSGTTNSYQAQPSTGTPSAPATNDIVLMRASATVAGKYEFILADKAGGGALNSQNTDGTEVDSTTTDLRFDKTTGSKITQSGGVSTHTLLAATPTQMGAVTTAAQFFEGDKQFNGDVVRTEATSGSGSSLYPAAVISIASSTPSIAIYNSSGDAGCVFTTGLSGTTASTQMSFGTLTGTGGGVAMSAFLNTSTLISTAFATFSNGNAPPLSIGAHGTDGKHGIRFRGNPPNLAVDVTWDLYKAVSADTSVFCTNDFEFTDIGEGPIVRSPDGTRWRIGVTNAGAVVAALA